MMPSQILQSMDSTKTQKSRHLENESSFFPHIKKIINEQNKGYFIAKNSFVTEVTFNQISDQYSFLHPVKVSKNQKFSDIFRGYRKEMLARNGLSTEATQVNTHHVRHKFPTSESMEKMGSMVRSAG